MNYLLKCSLWYSMLSFAFSLKLVLTKQNEVELNDEYGEDLNTIESTMNQIEKMSQKRTIKEIINKDEFEIDNRDITMHIANLLRCDDASNKSFYKLNSIANNKYKGSDKLKGNSKLKKVLKIILADRSFKMPCRVDAAQLATRLFDIPVTIQTTGKDPNKDSPTRDSYIIMPRVDRLYRPDKEIEKYKAGNWDV